MDSSTGKIATRIACNGKRSISLSPKHFYGDHQLKVGFDFSHSSYDGRQQFLSVDIVGVAGTTLQRIEFGAPTTFVRPPERGSRGLAEINGRLGLVSPSTSACALIMTPSPIRPTPRPAWV